MARATGLEPATSGVTGRHSVSPAVGVSVPATKRGLWGALSAVKQRKQEMRRLGDDEGAKSRLGRSNLRPKYMIVMSLFLRHEFVVRGAVKALALRWRRGTVMRTYPEPVFSAASAVERSRCRERWVRCTRSPALLASPTRLRGMDERRLGTAEEPAPIRPCGRMHESAHLSANEMIVRRPLPLFRGGGSSKPRPRSVWHWRNSTPEAVARIVFYGPRAH